LKITDEKKLGEVKKSLEGDSKLIEKAAKDVTKLNNEEK